MRRTPLKRKSPLGRGKYRGETAKFPIRCLYCGKDYVAMRKTRKFCSKLCIQRNHLGIKIESIVNGKAVIEKKGETIKCGVCRKEVYVMPCHVGVRKFCSSKCAHEGIKKRVEKVCESCKKIYSVRISQVRHRGSRYCSNECKAEGLAVRMSGANSHWWHGGVSGVNRPLRYERRAKKWRKSVFERDNWTCRECKVRGGYLEAHHIKPFAYFPDLRFGVSNGLTLCRSCHNKTKLSAAAMRKMYAKKV